VLHGQPSVTPLSAAAHTAEPRPWLKRRKAAPRGTLPAFSRSNEAD
jgi:hypothetical protein